MRPDATLWAMVVVHYRDQAAIVRLAGEVPTWTVRPHSIVVVDNSGDLDVRAMSDLGVVVETPGRNLGYAGAVNRGVRRIVADAPGVQQVLVCTQDAALEPATASRLLAEAAANDRAAVVAPLLVYTSAPQVVFSAGGHLSSGGVGTHPQQGQQRSSIADSVVDVHWVDGAITMLDIAAFTRIGGFDSRYFLYCEEIDYQIRLRRAGYTVRIDRGAIAFQEPGNYRSYLKYRNGLYLTRKLRGDLREWPWLRIFFRDIVRAIARRSTFSPLWAARGVLDAKRDRMGQPPNGLLAFPKETVLDVVGQ